MKFLESEVIYDLEATYEEMPVRGNAMVSGDDAADKRYEDEIIARLESGDVWAWAVVKVTATWKGLQGVAYVGGCSYANETEFKQPGGYYADMKQEALDDLKSIIKDLQVKICGLEVA